MSKPSEDISVNQMATLGLSVVIPVIFLLVTWAVIPAKMPPSKNFYIDYSN